MCCWLSPLIGGGVTILGVFIGAKLGYDSANKQEEARNSRLDKAAWRMEQASCVRELQYELNNLKGLLSGAENPEIARALPNLETLAPRNSAMMLCSRLEDPLGSTIYSFLHENAKARVKEWQDGDVTSWQPLNDTLAGYIRKLGEEVLGKFRPEGS